MLLDLMLTYMFYVFLVSDEATDISVILVEIKV